jgi:hypothetical protein
VQSQVFEKFRIFLYVELLKTFFAFGAFFLST